MRIVAICGSLASGIQAIVNLFTGSSICLDTGCEVVESLTVISPLYLNILGFVFFQTVFWLLYHLQSKPGFRRHLMGPVLLCGLTFDAALLGYQIFVAHAICSYCLLILFFVIILNILYGVRQTAAVFAILLAIVISFSAMTLLPAAAGSKIYSLKNASYGLKSCASPTKEIYLIFSSDCPHCQKVIETLNNCNSCDLYLNPIDPIRSLSIEGIRLNKSFSPEINRLILKVLEIDSVPVLVVKDEESYRFVRGEERILSFISRACFTHDEIFYLDRAVRGPGKEITVLTEEDEECSLEIDCQPKENE